MFEVEKKYAWSPTKKRTQTTQKKKKAWVENIEKTIHIPKLFLKSESSDTKMVNKNTFEILSENNDVEFGIKANLGGVDGGASEF